MPHALRYTHKNVFFDIVTEHFLPYRNIPFFLQKKNVLSLLRDYAATRIKGKIFKGGISMLLRLTTKEVNHRKGKSNLFKF